MNRLFILGNLGSEPEVKKFEGNSAVANLSVAVSETTKDANGNRVKTTEWFKCVCFNSLAVFVERHVRKGAKVLIEGRIRSRTYTDRNGNEKSVSEVLVDRLELLTWETPAPGNNPVNFNRDNSW
jgi:single-strand DNA-binding protein